MSLINSIFNFLRFNKKNWKAVVLCLFTATVFWFLNALNKSYSANINFPVTFDYDQEKYIPVKSLPASIRMNVSGLGWDLFRRSSGLKVPPLVIPIERPTEVRKIVGSTLPALFSTQVEGMQINFVLTDTVYIDIDQRARRKLWIAVDSVDQYIRDGFVVAGTVAVTPDTIWVEGPKKIITALPERLLVSLSTESIDKDFREEIEVGVKHRELISRNPPVVDISFQVEELVEKRDTVRLTIINVPARLRHAFAITEVVCTYQIPASLVGSVSRDSLVAVIDLRDMPVGSHKVVPRIEGLPIQARHIKADTVQVNF